MLGSVLLTACLCWFGVGLLYFAAAPRLRTLLRVEIPYPARGLLRATGLIALAASACALQGTAPGALVLVCELLAVMAASSIAALLAPVRPRLYAASLPLSALLAAACWFAH